jgi:glyoxylase-like metal-dependent hydrolase (beta-lactamase superfamily II)
MKSTTLTIISVLIHLTAGKPTPLSPLNWDVYLAPAIPVYSPGNNFTWSQTAFTLIHGASTAVLVDAPITASSTNALADWIDRTIPGKKLTSIYMTHGHGDHFFGIPVLQQRFPGVQAIATDTVISHAMDQLKPESLAQFWEVFFPGQIPPQTEEFNALPASGTFELEGHVLQAVPVGQTDTYNTTVLYVQDLDMVVAGDAVYGEYFQYLAESNTPILRADWLKALYDIQALKPNIVIPSHKQDWDGYGINHLDTTREFLTAWGLEVMGASGKDDLKKRMAAMFPARHGDFILEISAQAAFPSS